MPQSSILFEKGKNIHALANYYLNGINCDGFEKNLNPEEISLWEKLKANDFFKKEVIKTEFTLNFKLDENWFGGRIDAIVKSDNDYFILDYKTGNAPKEPKFDYQTMIYAVAVHKFIKNYNSLNFVYLELKTNQNKIINITENDIKEYLSKLNQTAQKINNLSEASLKRKENCNCEYTKICF